MVVGRLIPRVSRPLAAALVASTALVAATPIALGVVSGLLVAQLPRATHGSVPASMVSLAVAVGALLVVQELARQGLGLTSRTLGRRVDGDLRRRALAAALAPVGISHLEDPEVRDVFAAARNLSPFAFTPGDAAQQLGASVASRLQSLLAFAVVAVYLPDLAVAAGAVWVAAQVLALYMVVRIASTAIGWQGEDLLYLRDLVLTAPAAKEVRVFGLGSWLSGRFLDLARARFELALARRQGTARWYAAAAAVAGAGLLGSLAWVGVRGTDGTVSLTALAVVVAALLRAFTVPNVMLDVPIAYGMFAVPAIADAETAATVTVQATGAQRSVTLRDGITLHDVDFRYPRGERLVLDGLELTIPAGQRLAIVGLNGSGKTTLIKLLCRLYEPTGGEIRVDGVDLRDLDPAAWRTRLAVLFQDFIRYQLPARDNVQLGASSTTAARDALARAAAAAGASQLIGSLPSGWDTPLSPGRSGGVDLSGGQWQRLALARALHAVGTGARLLILDEPTANLDPNGEQRFYDEVLTTGALRVADDAGVPVTTILISHRFATVRHADRIVVLSGGRIVEDGDHDQLLAVHGQYRMLFDAQAAAFREPVP